MQINLAPLVLNTIDVMIVGTTPLIVHAWSQKAKREMLAKQMKIPVGAKEAKDPIEDFLNSLYRTDDGHFGIPAVGVKNAMVTACTSISGVTKVAARQAFRVIGERGTSTGAFCDIMSPTDLVRIGTPEPPRMREDSVRVGMGTADLRYRAEFFPWCMKIRVEHNRNVMSPEQIINLLNTAGFAVGLCEWRMEKDGQYGGFAVANAAEAKRCAGWLTGKQLEPRLPDVEAWRASLDEPQEKKPARKLRVA
jgi:hypothetical protein